MVDWPHAPIHRLEGPGAYFITAGTYLKQHFLTDARRLNAFRDLLFGLTAKHGLTLHAWAIFSNHYHFIVVAHDRVRQMIAELHSLHAHDVNKLDGVAGRKVWYQFWDKHLTFPRSYLARLNYVNQNPVHHGIVSLATNYEWCSAAWFEANVSASFAASVRRFATDRLNIPDDFRIQSGGKPPHS